MYIYDGKVMMGVQDALLYIKLFALVSHSSRVKVFTLWGWKFSAITNPLANSRKARELFIVMVAWFSRCSVFISNENSCGIDRSLPEKKNLRGCALIYVEYSYIECDTMAPKDLKFLCTKWTLHYNSNVKTLKLSFSFRYNIYFSFIEVFTFE